MKLTQIKCNTTLIPKYTIITYLHDSYLFGNLVFDDGEHLPPVPGGIRIIEPLDTPTPIDWSFDEEDSSNELRLYTDLPRNLR